jgi:hypothetical protein
MTNRQWLTSLSDRELIEFMLRFSDVACERCGIDVDDDCEGRDGYKCIGGLVSWLQDDYEEVR